MAFNTYNETGITYNQAGEKYNGGTNVTVTVSELVLTSSIENVTVITDDSVIVPVSELVLSTVLNTVTITTQRNNSVTVSPLDVSAVLNGVTIRIDKRVEVNELLVNAVLNDVTVSATRNISILVNVLELLASVQNATVPRIPSNEITVKPLGFAFRVKPISERNTDLKLKTFVNKTDATIINQNITYNQSGVTYNDIRYLYGGSNKNGDKENVVITTDVVKPVISYIGNNLPIQQ